MATINSTVGTFFDTSTAHQRRVGAYVGPTTYVSGGDPLRANDVSLGEIEHIGFGVATNGTLYRYLVYVPSTPGQGVVRWLDATNGTEIAGGTNLAAFSARFEAVGK